MWVCWDRNLGGVHLAYSKTEGEILLLNLCLIDLYLNIQWHNISVKYNSTKISCPFSLIISVLWFSWPELPNSQTITKETFLQSLTPVSPHFLSAAAFSACAYPLACECHGMPWCQHRDGGWMEWGLMVLVFAALTISNPNPGLTSLPNHSSALSPPQAPSPAHSATKQALLHQPYNQACRAQRILSPSQP